ncbi:hypothetical protein OAK96_06470 [Pseudomonadota bacterium]|nr:hypothetical protein [Pseudomonadota bacterium]
MMQNDKGLRIAIIGNMNNNGFSIMRYFRDLGIKAYLLPYSTDGSDTLSHFEPEADTWDIDRWKPFIRPLAIPNSSRGIMQAILSNVWPSKLKKDLLLNYDFFIGTGAAPAMFESMNLKLDIYYPYGVGIEFYGDLEFLKASKSSLFRSLVYGIIRRLQSRGIRKTRHCINPEMSLTKDSFEEIGRSFLRLSVPIVYNQEENTQALLQPRISSVIKQLQSYDLSVFSCASLLWDKSTLLSKFGEKNWKSGSKNNDWLFIGLAQFIHENPKARPVLVCAEYGIDVEVTKQLIDNLGIGKHVIWLPILQRKEIILVLQACDIGVGEFYSDPGVMWGGTGWEVLSCGKPLLQNFNFSKESFELEFGYPPPPILGVKSHDDVTRHLTAFYRNLNRTNIERKDILNWFERYGGMGLAKQWLDLLNKGDGEI